MIWSFDLTVQITFWNANYLQIIHIQYAVEQLEFKELLSLIELFSKLILYSKEETCV